MLCNSTRNRTVLVAATVILAALAGGLALTGSAVAAENLHDGSTTHPTTGETIYAANATEKKSITYGYSVDNVTSNGDTVKLYLTFEDPLNNSAGRLSSFSGNVTCISAACEGQSVSVSSSASTVDGPDGDGVKETIKIGVSPTYGNEPIDIMVNFTGDVTWTDEHTNVESNVSGAVIEPNKDITPPEKFEDIIIAGGLYTETNGSYAISGSDATLSAHLWNLNGTSSTDLWFTYWKQGQKSSTQQYTTHQNVSTVPATYSQNISGLDNGEVYVFRSAANNGKEYDSGPEFTFTTGGLRVTTEPSTNVTADTLTINGNLRDLGSSSSSEVWFTYWEKGAKSSTQQWTTHQTVSSTGSYSEDISVKPDTTYVVKAAANNSNNHDAGKEIEFTSNAPLSVATDSASNVTADSVTVNGNLTGLGDSTDSEVWFTYWEKGAKSSTQKWTTHQNVTSTGTFSETISVKVNTTYVVQAAANNGKAHETGAQVEVTSNAPLSVETDSASTVGSNSATLNGNLTGLGDSTDSEVWFTYWEKGAKSSTQQWTTHLTRSSTGTYSEEVTGLNSGTTYVYQAAANNGKAYENGTQVEFTTN